MPKVKKSKAKDVIENTMPPTTQALVKRSESHLLTGSLEQYLAEINRFPVLTRDEEYALALHYWKTQDPQAAHQLITANLRFVVKIAMQYAKYGVKLKDLIQEGNIGLMMAVRKYNPNMGNRLISYAVWWIRAYIQKYLLDSWSMVRLGTTQAQRKIFNGLKRLQRKIMATEGVDPSNKVLAEKLQVSESEVQQMRQRMQGHDLSLDAPLDEDGSTSRLDTMPSQLQAVDDMLIQRSDQALIRQAIKILRHQLNANEIEILEKRLLAEEPITLQEIGDGLKISRERVRQIEEALKKKLRHVVERLQTAEEITDG